jgi:hypothetical protein
MAGTREIHPASAAVVVALDEAVAGLVYWSGRDLDASVELDDVVQEVALAQLEAQAAGVRSSDSTLRREVQRRARRELWQVRWSRGREHRVGWTDAHLRYLVGPDPGLAAAEELGWHDLIERLGWQDALALWLWAVEDWPLSAIGEWQAITKQRARRRLMLAVERLRGWLAAEAG